MSPSIISSPASIFSNNVGSFYGNTNAQSAVAMQVIYNGRVITYDKQASTPIILNYGSG